MGNPIKYSITSTSGSYNKGNVAIGTNPINYAPSSTTGWYNSVTPSGGNFIVMEVVDGNTPPRFYAPTTDNEWLRLAIQEGATGANTGSTAAIKSWFASQTNYAITNMDFPTSMPNIVGDGLILNLDAGINASYPGTGTTWTDISGLGNNGTLTNGPTFNSANSGSIVFDGTNDYISVTPSQGINVDVNFSIQTWVKINKFGGGPDFQRASIVTNSYPYNTNQGFWLACTSQAGPAQNYAPTVGLENFFLSMGNDQYCVAPSPGSLSAYINSWVNIGVRVNGTNLMKCYINGVEVSSYACQSNGPSSYLYTNGPFSLGNRNNSAEYLSGSIASFLMYNRAISDAEFLQNYNAQKSRFGY